MKQLISIAAITMLAVAAGCSNTNSKTADSKVLTPTPATPVMPAPTGEQQAGNDQGPLVVDTRTPATPAVETGTPSGAGGTYVVKHGDTLFHIAAVTYGSGREWTKIASANPGVDAKHLKVGQKLILP